MPKKRRSDGKGNVHPTDMPDRWPWKCSVKGCPVNGKAATKADAEDARLLHESLVH